MPLSKLKFMPGINRDISNLSNMGSWYDGDKIRFRGGYPEKIGGWKVATFDQYVGEATAMHVYRTDDGSEIAGLGTTKKVYIRSGTSLYDITPIRATFTSPATDNCISTVNTSTTVTITIVGHGATTGDYVTFSGATTVGGIDVDGEYEIVTVPTADTFTITHSTAATATASGGGTSIIAAFQINIGAGTSTYGYGFGAGVWSRGTWGSGATVPIYNPSRQIFMDDFNNDLIFNVGNGNIYYWVYSAGFSNRAVLMNSLSGSIAVPEQVGNLLFAPSGHLLALDCTAYNETTTAGQTISSITRSGTTATVTTTTNHGLATRDWVTMSNQQPKGYVGNYQITVTSDTTFTYTMAYDPGSNATTVGTYVYNDYSGGAKDKLLIRWADVNADIGPKPEYWKPEVANTAGFLRVKEGNEIIAAINARQETLVWTNTAINTLQFLGTAEVFGLQLLSNSVSIAGPNAVTTVNNVVYWMGTDNFYIYDGRVNVLRCNLRRYVFDDINKDQLSIVYAGVNKEFSEIIWFYTSEASTIGINRYVIYNYQDDIWYYGQLTRNTWVDAGINEYPLATYNGYIYEHENGHDDGQPGTTPSNPITAYIQSSFMDINEGENFMLTRRVIPDVDFTESDTVTATGTALIPEVTMTVGVSKFPGAATAFTAANGASLAKDVVTVSGNINQYTNQVFVRARGRQMNFKIESDTLGTQWQYGTTRVDARPNGRRG